MVFSLATLKFGTNQSVFTTLQCFAQLANPDLLKSFWAVSAAAPWQRPPGLQPPLHSSTSTSTETLRRQSTPTSPTIFRKDQYLFCDKLFLISDLFE